MKQIFSVNLEHIRLDAFLSKNINATKNQTQDLIKTIGVLVNKKEIKKCGFFLKIHDKVEIDIPNKQQNKTKTKVEFDIPIIYQDEDIMVINKPHGLTVHRAQSEKNPTVVDWLESKNISLSNLSGKDRNGIVHRLDKPTSGVMVVAKNNKAHLHLSNQLKDKTMGRYYLGIINPVLKDDCIIDKEIGRSKNNRIAMTSHNPIKPRNAKTTFKKLLPSKNLKYELIAAKLDTGRTHQIRVHLQSIQRHILGDNTYKPNNNDKLENKILLQAYILYLKHPINNKNIVFKSDLNKDMEIFLKEHFNIGQVYEAIDTRHIFNLFGDSN